MILKLLLPLLFSAIPLQPVPDPPLAWPESSYASWLQLDLPPQKLVLESCSDVIQFPWGTTVILITDPAEAEIIKQSYPQFLQRDQNIRWYIDDPKQKSRSNNSNE